MAIRPSTLPGLNREPDKLATLAGRVVLDSPKASTEVKAYARSLVQGILRFVGVELFLLIHMQKLP